MKTNYLTKTLLLLFAIIAINNTIYAQPNTMHWRLGGNTTAPFFDNVTLPGRNFLGIAFGNLFVNSTPLLIGTGGTSSIYVDAVLGPNPHFVGIGVGFTTPTQLLDVSGGNIDILTANKGYMINDNYVLRGDSNKNVELESMQAALQFKTDTSTRMLITQKGNVVVYNSFILKSTNGNKYFSVTVNNNGELKATEITQSSL